MAQDQDGTFQTPQGDDLTKTPLVQYRRGEISPDEDEQDPDDLALQEAANEVRAEQGQPPAEPGPAPNQPPQDPPVQPSQQPPAAPAPAAPAGPAPAPAPGTHQQPPEQHMIPKARFDAAMAKKDEVIGQLSEDNQRLIGATGYLTAQSEMFRQRLDALEAPAQEAQRQAAEKGFDDRVAAEDARLAQAVADFDEGKIQMAGFKEVENSVVANKAGIETERASFLEQRAQTAQPQPQPQPTPAPAPASNTGSRHPASYSLADRNELDRQEAQLVQDHPYLGYLSDGQMAELSGMARARLEARGEDVSPGPIGDYNLRREVGALSDVFGPQWYQDPSAPAPVQQQPNGGTPPGQPGLSPNAQGRLNKMEMAQQMPPDPANFGTGADAAGGVPTEAQINAMSEDELAALPPGMLDRLSV